MRTSMGNSEFNIPKVLALGLAFSMVVILLVRLDPLSTKKPCQCQCLLNEKEKP